MNKKNSLVIIEQFKIKLNNNILSNLKMKI